MGFLVFIGFFSFFFLVLWLICFVLWCSLVVARFGAVILLSGVFPLTLPCGFSRFIFPGRCFSFVNALVWRFRFFPVIALFSCCCLLLFWGLFFLPFFSFFCAPSLFLGLSLIHFVVCLRFVLLCFGLWSYSLALFVICVSHCVPLWCWFVHILLNFCLAVYRMTFGLLPVDRVFGAGRGVGVVCLWWVCRLSVCVSFFGLRCCRPLRFTFAPGGQLVLFGFASGFSRRWVFCGLPPVLVDVRGAGCCSLSAPGGRTRCEVLGWACCVLLEFGAHFATVVPRSGRSLSLFFSSAGVPSSSWAVVSLALGASRAGLGLDRCCPFTFCLSAVSLWFAFYVLV